MSSIRYQLLLFVETYPGLTIAEIAGALGWDQKYTRRHLDKARVRGLLSRRDHQYALTTTGQRRLDYVREHGLVEVRQS